MDDIRGTRLEINLEALRFNINEIMKYKKKDVKLCAVVKANAYGCGLLRIAEETLKYGADYLGVAILDEGIYLRKNGILGPILIQGLTEGYRLEQVVKFNLIQTISDIEIARELNAIAAKENKKAKVHIKIDTGMCRIGFSVDRHIKDILIQLKGFENIEIEGIFTHLSKVYDSDYEFSKKQIDRFLSVLQILEELNLDIPIKHILSSGGFIEYPEYHLDMVRLGNILYGLYPPCSKDDKLLNQSTFTFKTRIALIKEVEAGEQISYSGKYATSQKRIIATLPVGYADGYPRRLSCKGRVIINNQLAPIVGNICMDMCMVDITDIRNTKVGDEVILIGKSGDLEITLNDINEIVQSVRTELISNISQRVPRVYI